MAVVATDTTCKTNNTAMDYGCVIGYNARRETVHQGHYMLNGLTRANYGRDHHPDCFTYWLAGGGVKGGFTYGRTDDYGVNVVENPVHVHDLQATILHLLGIDHERFTFKHQGRRYRLTDVHGKVVKDVLG